MIVVIVLLLVKWAVGQSMNGGPGAPLRISGGQKMTADQFHKLSDDPYSDPADEIPHGRPSSTYKPPDILGPGERRAPMPLEDFLAQTVAPKTEEREESKKRARLWIDFQNIHDRLVEYQARPDYVSKDPDYITTARPSALPKVEEFEPFRFDIKSADIFRNYSKFLYKPTVWTTCDQFKQSSVPYNQDDVVGINWLPFYTWSAGSKKMAFIHRYEVPSQKTVYNFYNQYARYTNKTVDWDQPKMVLTVGRHYEDYLFIAADKTGLYYMIMAMEITEFVQRTVIYDAVRHGNNVILPLASMRIKLVGEYLAMMNCEGNSAAIMAREGHIPATNKEKNDAARVLKFRGRGRPVTRNFKLEKRLDENNAEIKKYYEELGQPLDIAPKPSEKRRRTKKPVRVKELEKIPDMAAM